MKPTIKSAIAVILCCLICGCSVSEESRAEHNEETQLTFSEQPDITSAEIPVLSIVTGNGKNDFAEKPVSEFVSEQIASWTPGYVMPPAPYYEDCKISLKEGNDTIIDSAEASVKVRGNWTTNYSKNKSNGKERAKMQKERRQKIREAKNYQKNRKKSQDIKQNGSSKNTGSLKNDNFKENSARRVSLPKDVYNDSFYTDETKERREKARREKHARQKKHEAISL